MKFIAPALALGQLGAAASLGGRHAHGAHHVHTRRAADTVAEPEPVVPFHNFMASTDISRLAATGIKLGTNLDWENSQGVSIGYTEDAPYLVYLNNKGTKDLVVVSWSGIGQWGAIAAMGVGDVEPDITSTLQPGTGTVFAYDPRKYKGGNSAGDGSAAGNSISGAISAVYDGIGLSTRSGQVNNTWVEYTFSLDNAFSTVDVSRLVNMWGHRVETATYADEAQHAAGNSACRSTMDQCVFKCDPGVDWCIYGGTVKNCVAGQPGNTVDPSGKDGGCAGMGVLKGVAEINFYDDLWTTY